MQILDHKIKLAELKPLADKMFGNIVKGVVDVERELVAIDGEMHSDLQELLVGTGSRGVDIWGFNIQPVGNEDNWLEFDSMVNVKPLVNNRTRSIEDSETRARAEIIIRQFIEL